MILNILKEIKVNDTGGKNTLMDIELTAGLSVEVYTQSITENKNILFFIGKELTEKSLFLVYDNKDCNVADKFGGVTVSHNETGTCIKKCELTHTNATLIGDIFEYTKPIVIGLNNSFGFGDRLGLANAAHIRSLDNSDFKPVLAQQSIRELTRTQRTPAEVMDAAIWAVFQEGYKSGFGSDADHLKTTGDIDMMINAGFTMFTFDPREHVINEADILPIDELLKITGSFPWNDLNDTFESMLNRYTDVSYNLGEGFTITAGRDDVIRAITKYGKAVAHIVKLYSHLKNTYTHHPYEVEVSVDETESVTTPFEHFFMSSELQRLGVKIISLAPRFIGDFEKGIDYRGDIELFKEEYLKHVKIAEYFGSYKISLHSGSDKFGVYNAIGSLHRGFTHVKTAGTSYLEALRVVAAKEPGLLREILDFSRGLYEQEKQSYHVSADINKVLPASEYTDNDLPFLFEQEDARQVLHVTFGKVLTGKKSDGSYLFRERILNCLKVNENVHYEFLYKHFRKHLDPFNKE
jgi:hypothetical protein